MADYLCEKFDMDVVEMDQVIAERERMSISDIFEKHGELYFRDLETKLLVELQEKSNTVVSCRHMILSAIWMPCMQVTNGSVDRQIRYLDIMEQVSSGTLKTGQFLNKRGFDVE